MIRKRRKVTLGYTAPVVMTRLAFGSLFFGLAAAATAAGAPAPAPVPSPVPAPAPVGMPALRRQGNATQLLVDGKPFLILGGELGNSTASSAESLAAAWPKIAAVHANTVLVPVYWELIEPAEGTFEFASVTRAIEQARQHQLRLVLLWFGSWKNGMSSYVPAWVKRDSRRFPRAEVAGGRAVEALSAFSVEGAAVDGRAFAALMRHLRRIDGARHTVLMVQVENEVAMIEEAADRSAAAQRAFAAPVPAELVGYLQAHRATLAGALAQAWKTAGERAAGTWSEVFGPGPATEEIFMAWYFARYVDAVARAGRAQYALPLFVNAALNRPGARPGQYPSGGPLPHLYDVWRAGAPTVDFLSPDIYYGNFAEWTGRYARSDNPLFVPEAKNDLACAVNAIYAIGAHQALGFSPFAIESIERSIEGSIERSIERSSAASAPAGAAVSAGAGLAASYRILGQLAPLLLEQRGRGTVTAVLLDKESPSQEVKLGEHRLLLRHDYTWEWSGPARLAPTWPRAAAVIISTGPREYIVAGSGVIATFAPEPPIAGVAGIERIEEGRFQNGKWIAGRRFNGDENHQGRHLRLPAGEFGIQRIWLYR